MHGRWIAVLELELVDDEGTLLGEPAESLLGLERLRLGLLELGDVEHHPLEQARTTVSIAGPERRTVQHPDDATVGREVAVLGAERLARLDAVLGERDDAVAIVRMEALLPEAGAMPVLAREPEDRLELRAGVERGIGRLGVVFPVGLP